MRLGVDLDGVLADFNSAFIRRIVQTAGEDRFPPRPFDIPCWHYPEHYGYSAEVVNAVWQDIHRDSTFWRSLPAYGEAHRHIRELAERSLQGDSVYFITARTGLMAKQQTERWLQSHGGGRDFIPTVLLTADKAGACRTLHLDVYIDDNRENCDAVHTSTSTRVFLYDQPWNRDGVFDPYTRVRSLDEFFLRAQ